MHPKELKSPVEGAERFRELYPFVDERKTPLPKGWSPTDKCSSLGISHSSLRVTYRGHGKNHKDAAAVRANAPIPTNCGIYYYEVKIVSKGRDGYMGIGVCQKEVSTGRLPGWERGSYGYHGDDGNSFCSSGSGVTYGPTFTTGDIIGCGVNMLDHTCFYTKNGQNLGTAFTDLSDELYPTVGLQTPGEVIDTNFGQEPFVYEIMEDLKEARMRVGLSIEQFKLPSPKGVWFEKLVASYLVHHGFCASAESFNAATGHSAQESPPSIKNRQRIQKLVMEGRIGEAIKAVRLHHPGLLEKRPRLLFILQLRQFIEMVAGSETERARNSAAASPSSSPPNKIPVLKSPYPSPRDSPRRIKSPRSRGSPHVSSDMEEGTSRSDHHANGSAGTSGAQGSDVPMELSENGASTSRSQSERRDESPETNGASEEMMDADEKSAMNGRGSGEVGVESLLLFGRDLRAFSDQLYNAEKEVRMMNDAFSLLAYPQPWDSQVSYLLSPSQREPVASALNSAILEEQGFSGKPPLETVVGHARRLRDRMGASGLGAAAFTDLPLLGLAESGPDSDSLP